MFDRFARSWRLVKASAAVLGSDKSLLVFPLLSGMAALAVLLCFALPMVGMAAMDRMTHTAGPGMGLAVLGFLFYLTNYFVMFFFNAALVFAAMKRLNGEAPTVAECLRAAAARWASLLGYAAIAATVGMLLRALQERAGWLGRIVVGLIGMVWTVATYLVVPVLVARDVGPIQAVQESVGLLRKTWGENLVGQAGIGIIFAFVNVGIIIAGALLLLAAVASGNALAIALALSVAIVALIASALVHSALSGIYAAALYRYATGEGETAGFDAYSLQGAFAART